MIPDQVKLSQDMKSIQIGYDDGKFLILSSLLLRAKSPSAENKKNLESPINSKFENVLIKKVDKVGNYALRIVFSDGHDTGIYSWKYLYEIGTKNQDVSTP